MRTPRSKYSYRFVSRWRRHRYRRHIPGRSSEWQPSLLRNVYRILGRVGFPVECAYDTITIGKKIAQPDRAAAAA